MNKYEYHGLIIHKDEEIEEDMIIVVGWMK